MEKNPSKCDDKKIIIVVGTAEEIAKKVLLIFVWELF